MKALSIVIILAGALALSAGSASAQIRVGGHGAAGTPANGSSLPKGTAESGRVDIGGGRRGPYIGAGGYGRFSAGIGSSRVNSAISSQGRGRRGGHSR